MSGGAGTNAYKAKKDLTELFCSGHKILPVPTTNAVNGIRVDYYYLGFHATCQYKIRSDYDVELRECLIHILLPATSHFAAMIYVVDP